MGAGGFVGAMLAPHHAEDAQLDHAGLAAHQPQDAVIFGVRKPVLADDLRRDGSSAVALMTGLQPGSGTGRGRRCGPSSGSTTRSGCGIRPSTLRFSLMMPAMLRAEPLGLSPGIAEDHAALAFQPIERLRLGEIVAFAMRHRKRHPLALVIFAGEDAGFPPLSSVTGRQTNFRPALRISAPGSRWLRSAPGSRCRCPAPRRPCRHGP